MCAFRLVQLIWNETFKGLDLKHCFLIDRKKLTTFRVYCFDSVRVSLLRVVEQNGRALGTKMSFTYQIGTESESKTCQEAAGKKCQSQGGDVWERIGGGNESAVCFKFCSSCILQIKFLFFFISCCITLFFASIFPSTSGALRSSSSSCCASAFSERCTNWTNFMRLGSLILVELKQDLSVFFVFHVTLFLLAVVANLVKWSNLKRTTLIKLCGTFLTMHVCVCVCATKLVYSILAVIGINLFAMNWSSYNLLVYF